MVRLPKPDGGGWRLIGILANLLRHWGRARHSHTKAWEKEHQAPQFWGGIGKPTTQAVVEHAFEAELAKLADGHSAT
eukprot:8015723-Lingulodinium_polyedra.AAC.1